MSGDPGAIVPATLIALFYMLPTLIAYGRDIPQRQAIAVANMLLGWTLIGWVVAVIWATNAPNQAVPALRSRSY